MKTLEKHCVLASRCAIAGTERCNITCFPFVLTHGVKGTGGFWKTTNVPGKYKDRFITNFSLIESQNPTAYKVVFGYLENISAFVAEGMGLFLYAIPNQSNKMGTGNGKTTAATTIINEFLIARIIEHVKGERPITVNPALFTRLSEFQVTYNSQFKGTQEMKEQAAAKYETMKRLMKESELLCIDDIGLRGSTEAFTNELYEILDERSIEGRCTIFTSNQPIERIGEILSEQIASRIHGMTNAVPFIGKDNRRK
ncbi:ATP-binding protein [Bacillus wiedmannii]|uniref:ATP-binding protein n=1 Tax=Bacillus wiedmannii TaxID=1890302 RepID=UPI000BF08A30|nr:ATP-binding protein [Bacillus wiedmannii]PEM08515.1 DNA replication protein [Bacillus wiedmannii]